VKTLQLFILILISGIVFGEDYIGSEKCKICHKKELAGQQYAIWSKGPHAGSFETLKSEKSVRIARELGLDVAPDQAPECLRCHVTGWKNGGYQIDVDSTDTRALKMNSDLARVGCEACHGSGKSYKSKKTMVGIYSGELAGADYGLLPITANSCTSCHNSDSPTYKGFVFADRVTEIIHPIPPK
jgi:hypothetical protein